MLSGPARDPWHRSVSAFGASPKSWRLLLRCNVCGPRQALSLALVLARLRPERNKTFFSCLSNPLLPAPPDEEKVFKSFNLISWCGDYLCLFMEHNFETILGGPLHEIEKFLFGLFWSELRGSWFFVVLPVFFLGLTPPSMSHLQLIVASR
jgi:hypothetical protein